MSNTTAKSKTMKKSYRNQPLKARIFAPIGPDGTNIVIAEVCEGKTTFLIPDEVRIPYMQGLLDEAAEALSKL
jgi:hypothetical protein